jgi:hypothetical protein
LPLLAQAPELPNESAVPNGDRPRVRAIDVSEEPRQPRVPLLGLERLESTLRRHPKEMDAPCAHTSQRRREPPDHAPSSCT